MQNCRLTSRSLHCFYKGKREQNTEWKVFHALCTTQQLLCVLGKHMVLVHSRCFHCTLISSLRSIRWRRPHILLDHFKRQISRILKLHLPTYINYKVINKQVHQNLGIYCCCTSNQIDFFSVIRCICVRKLG